MSDGEFIKIGYTARDIKTRIKELNTGNVKHIYLCGFVQLGSMDLEQQLHKKFEYAKKNREWYNASPLLISWINSNSDIMAEVENVNGKLYVYKKMKC